MNAECSCLELFECGRYDGRDLQIAVDQEFPEFFCENETCSSNSPGVIVEHEQLAFLLIEPIHFDDETGQISPDAFQEVTRRDLSLLREEHCNPHIANSTKQVLSTARKPEQERYIDKVSITTAAKIRQTLLNERRVVGVYDTALEENPSHASVFATAEMLSNTRGRKMIRKICHDIFSQEIQEFSEFLDRLSAS